MDIIESSYVYLKSNLERLSKPFEEQSRDIEDFARWNLASDIASDWENCECCIKCLFDHGIINECINNMFMELLKKFDERSYDGSKYDESLWTVEGVKNDPFWENQRDLSRKLLTEFNKITI